MEATRLASETTLFDAPQAFPAFRTAAVLGAGTMGAQIAAHLANAGLEVQLLDIAPDDGSDKNAIVRRGLERARKASPAPFFSEQAAKRITTGNFDDDFGRIADADWVIEAVVERLDVKRSLFDRVEETVSADAIVSSNTSGLSISSIVEGRSEPFRRRFLGTHFFNPPRYLKLLELVPSSDTDPDVVRRIAHFGRIFLGKGIVVAKDTPYFIGNRIGVYAMLQAMRKFTQGEYTIEEIDTLTGPLTGRPKSGTFRTADVVGLDVMKDVAENLYEAVPNDDAREAFRAPELLEKLVERGSLGQKSGEGFYRKEGKTIKSVDSESLEYGNPAEQRLPGADAVQKAGALADRLRTLYEDNGRAGSFFRETMLDLLTYSARRVPEITENPADVDRAIRWGFGWEMGPFEIWDALGFERILTEATSQGYDVPDWVHSMRQEERTSFYRRSNGRLSVYVPSESDYIGDPRPDDHISLDIIKSSGEREIWASDSAALLDIGEGVALFEFRSKANTLGSAVMEALREAIDRVEHDSELKGLVVANEGKNFSVGANLVEMATAVQQGDIDLVAEYLRSFQQTIQRVRYARKPVCVAVHQRVLGGACEMVMACPNPVAAAESYIGLVELGVGLIPAGTGSMRLAELASRRAPKGHANFVQAVLQGYFENVAMAKVASSASEAREMGYLAPHARIVMHEDRRIYVGREEVRRLSSEGYMPPARSVFVALGRPTAAAFEVSVQQYVEGEFISEYDAFLANRLAFVITGGELSAPQEVDEEYMLELERDVFLGLLGREESRDRITHMLEKGKPLRN